MSNTCCVHVLRNMVHGRAESNSVFFFDVQYAPPRQGVPQDFARDLEGRKAYRLPTARVYAQVPLHGWWQCVLIAPL